MRAVCLLIALALTGCGTTPASSPSSGPGTSAAQSEDPTPLSTPPGLAEGEQPHTCGGPLTFGAAALLGDPGAETADHPAAEALRALIADSPLPEADSPLPERDQEGWLVVVLTEEDALFLLPTPLDADHAYSNAEFNLGDSGWEFVRSGQCDVKPWFEGLETARWELPPGSEPSSDSQTLNVLVFELSCASGQGPEGRIVLADVAYLDDSVVVTLGTEPLPGPQTCQGSPPGEYSFDLEEPLGERKLYDGWVYPPEPRGGG
jgi:hypothetical protein